MLSKVVQVYIPHYIGGWGRRIPLAQEFTRWDKRVRSHLKSNYHNNQINLTKQAPVICRSCHILYISQTQNISQRSPTHLCMGSGHWTEVKFMLSNTFTCWVIAPASQGILKPSNPNGLMVFPKSDTSMQADFVNLFFINCISYKTLKEKCSIFNLFLAFEWIMKKFYKIPNILQFCGW